ncbi:MAG TPA: hypothetical protein VIX82_04895 [Solirubrobacteraceae bacterium]
MGSSLLGLLAVEELADETVGTVAEGGDITERRVLDGCGRSHEDVDAAKDGAGVAEQGGGALDVSGGGDRVEAGHAGDSAVAATPAASPEVPPRHPDAHVPIAGPFPLATVNPGRPNFRAAAPPRRS